MADKKLIPGINGLRAISILIVLLSHWATTPNMPSFLKDVLSFIADGKVGVRFFFIISGFLITYLLFAEKQKYGKINLKKFYLRRLFRIFPVFYVYLLCLYILGETGLAAIDDSSLVFGILYIENFRYSTCWLTGHSWSLAVEEQFYLLWPAITCKMERITLKHLFIGLIVGALMRVIDYKYTAVSPYFLAPFLIHADFLFIGSYLGYQYCFHRGRLESVIDKSEWWMILCSTIMIWFLTRFENHPSYDILLVPASGTLIAICSSFILIYFIFRNKGLGGRMLNSRIFDFTGKLSYSLYVWQQLFLGSSFTLSQKIEWMSLYPQNIIFAGAAALASYYLVEKPFLKLKERFNA